MNIDNLTVNKQDSVDRIGCHLSISQGYFDMIRVALALKASTFAFFLRNPRGGSAHYPDKEYAKEFLSELKKNNMGPLVVHAPYTMNLCSNSSQTRKSAENTLKEELDFMENLPGNYYNLHPGSHCGSGYKCAIQRTADALNRVIKPEQNTIVLLETMSGRGTEIGSTFEQLAEIIDRVELKDKIGVCLDTCHVWAAGYDLDGDLDDVLISFDAEIGLRKLKAIHLNDSVYHFGSHKDRHQNLGSGTIGSDALRCLVRRPVFKDVPIILETPGDYDNYREEIKKIKEWRN